MKKIIITEQQLDRILNEQENNRYSRTVRVHVWGSSERIRYNGHEINDFLAPEIKLTFTIEQEQREWGIKGISLYNIQGPPSIEVEVDYYIDDDHQQTATINLPLDWENNLNTNSLEGNGIISIADELDIELINGKDGNLIGKMELDVYTL